MHTHSTSQAQPPLQPKHKPNTRDIASQLCRIARADIHAINTRDFSRQSPSGLEVLSHISPDFAAIVDNIPYPLNWDELNDAWRAWADADDRFEFIIRDCSAYVNEQTGRASVYVDLDVVGVSNVELKGLTEQCWKREAGGKWMFYKLWASRAMHGSDGSLMSEW